MKQKKNIIEMVENNTELQAIIENMFERKFLFPGAFNQLAYLKDIEKIESEWAKSKNVSNALACGIIRYFDFFAEGMNSVSQGKDFIVTKRTRKRLNS